MKKKMFWAALLVCLLIGLVGGCKAASNDFEITNGVLKSYCGQSSIVTVPNGVRVIGSNAFTACPYEIKKLFFRIPLPLSAKLLFLIVKV